MLLSTTLQVMKFEGLQVMELEKFLQRPSVLENDKSGFKIHTNVMMWCKLWNRNQINMKGMYVEKSCKTMPLLSLIEPVPTT